MSDALTRVTALKRPRLLIRAARHGMAEYSRERLLERRPDIADKGGDTVLGALIDAEEVLEETRRKGDAAYSVARHVELLIAVMAEARRLIGGVRTA